MAGSTVSVSKTLRIRYRGGRKLRAICLEDASTALRVLTPGHPVVEINLVGWGILPFTQRWEVTVPVEVLWQAERTLRIYDFVLRSRF